MAGLGIGLGAAFRLCMRKDLVEALSEVGVQLSTFLPVQLRRIFTEIVRGEEIHPLPTYLGAVSLLADSCTLQLYIFVGSDIGLFETVPGLLDCASRVEVILRGLCRQLLPEDCDGLLDHLSVVWEPNLLSII